MVQFSASALGYINVEALAFKTIKHFISGINRRTFTLATMEEISPVSEGSSIVLVVLASLLKASM